MDEGSGHPCVKDGSMHKIITHPRDRQVKSATLNHEQGCEHHPRAALGGEEWGGGKVENERSGVEEVGGCYC